MKFDRSMQALKKMYFDNVEEPRRRRMHDEAAFNIDLFKTYQHVCVRFYLQWKEAHS